MFKLIAPRNLGPIPAAAAASSVPLAIFAWTERTVVCGVVLDVVTRGRREMKRLRYLEIPATWAVVDKNPGS